MELCFEYVKTVMEAGYQGSGLFYHSLLKQILGLEIFIDD